MRPSFEAQGEPARPVLTRNMFTPRGSSASRRRIFFYCVVECDVVCSYITPLHVVLAIGQSARVSALPPGGLRNASTPLRLRPPVQTAGARRGYAPVSPPALSGSIPLLCVVWGTPRLLAQPLASSLGTPLGCESLPGCRPLSLWTGRAPPSERARGKFLVVLLHHTSGTYSQRAIDPLMLSLL